MPGVAGEIPFGFHPRIAAIFQKEEAILESMIFMTEKVSLRTGQYDRLADQIWKSQNQGIGGGKVGLGTLLISHQNGKFAFAWPMGKRSAGRKRRCPKQRGAPHSKFWRETEFRRQVRSQTGVWERGE